MYHMRNYPLLFASLKDSLGDFVVCEDRGYTAPASEAVGRRIRYSPPTWGPDHLGTEGYFYV